ncbi:hypothetical protein [Bacillus sp. JJ1474]|uniref:hypothetical protein n=1 Tax=Bacillus sp. JJ1474 TaxID=3122955 RepID=UPI002FFFED5D
MNLKKIFVLSFLCLFIIMFQTSDASAKVMWGKTELKKGQIGKVTILRETPVVNLDDKGNISSVVKRVNKGDEFRVYSYQNKFGGLYGLGGGLFVQKNEAAVKYETPSKAKLALLEAESKPQQPEKPKEKVKTDFAKLNEAIETLSIQIDKGISQKEYSTQIEALFQSLEKNSNKLSPVENALAQGRIVDLTKKTNVHFDFVIYEFGNGEKFFSRNDEKNTVGSVYPNKEFEGKLYPTLSVFEEILGITNNEYEVTYKKVSGGLNGVLFPMSRFFTSEKEYVDISKLDSDYYFVHTLVSKKNDQELVISTKDKRYAKEMNYNYVESPISLDEFIDFFDLNVTYKYENKIMTVRFLDINAPKERP